MSVNPLTMFKGPIIAVHGDNENEDEDKND
jgi:hypothetical protein